MSDATRIKELLRERVAALAQYLFPHGHREGIHWCVGDITGAPGKSFKICIAGEKAALWGDFAESGKHSRSLLDLWMHAHEVDFKTALREAAEWLGVSLSPGVAQASEGPPSQKLNDWQRCVDAFTEKHLERLAEWRGYSGEICSWLKESRLVGLHDNCIAFPVHDRAGKVVAVHYRLKDGSWRYYPQGAKVRPLVIGELVSGDPVHVFESQWDAFTFMDVSRERSGIIITRGASNGALVSALIPENSTAYVWTQNDAAGEKWAKDICASAKAAPVMRAKIPAQFKDVNDWRRAGAITDDLFAAMIKAEVVRELPRPLIEFKTPLELKNFSPPPGVVLAGDCHVARGSVFVIGGPPGVGKSRASVGLAEAGATGDEWFGLSVHRRFKTMIIQTENGLFRLSKEFSDLDCDALESYVRICPPPPFGLCLGREDFRAQLATAIRDFEPDVIVLDPWNAAARDEKAREYLETFELIRSVLPTGDDAPAIGIVAHTRKPRADERTTGRGLLNLLAGSYVLGSVPRTVFVMQAASDETEDNRIVWTCCKNNDGELGGRSAWERRNGLFAPISEFDWDTFDNPQPDNRVTITADHLAEIFENSDKQLTKADAVRALQTLTEAGRTACYNALRPDGRFAKQLREADGLLSWKP
jgi:AAA domain